MENKSIAARVYFKFWRGNEDKMRVMVITKKNLIISGILLACILLSVVLSTAMCDRHVNALSEPDQYTVDCLAGKHKELPVYSVQREDKKIALTIDAAWEDDKTDFILEQLNKYNIKATFFLCGFWVEKYPEHVKAIAANGHEIGNHSLTHPHMNNQTAEQILDEIKQLDDRIEALCGKRSTIFRAPYGEYNDNVVTTVRSAGYEIVQWDIDTIDWKESRSAQTILDSVLPKLHPGCIILCHNNGFKIKEYLPMLIETAISQGYEFVTVSELLLGGNTLIDVNGVQKPAA